MAILTLFDLDHTLLATDTNQAWVRYLIDRGLLAEEPHGHAVKAMERRYREGTDDIDLEFCEFFISTLVHIAPPQLKALLADFTSQRLVPWASPAARSLVGLHRHLGDTLAIITATNRIITEAIAAYFGIEHLIATEPEVNGAAFTGRVAGIPSMRSGKVVRLKAWLAGGHLPGVSRIEDLDVLRFYSDSINDRPLLELATEAIAVDPDAPLRELALARGWPIISLAAG